MRTSVCFCSSLMVWSARIARVRSGVPLGRLEDPCLHVEGLGRDAQRLGDLLEDLGRGPPQPALDLAQIRVGDAGQLRETPEREAGGGSLLTDEGPEVEPTVALVRAHCCKRTASGAHRGWPRPGRTAGGTRAISRTTSRTTGRTQCDERRSDGPALFAWRLVPVPNAALSGMVHARTSAAPTAAHTQGHDHD